MDNMNITSAKYIVDSVSGETRAIKFFLDGIQMQAPLDPSNRHYAEIMRQVDAGTLTIAEAE